MAQGDSIRLSDDEITALAIEAQRPWPGPLPTLGEQAPEQLTRAAARGLRSLAIRDLVTAGSVLTDELAPVAAALRGRAAVRTYLSDTVLTPSDRGAVTTFFATESGDVVVDVTSLTGVHAIAAVPAERVRIMLIEAAGAAFHRSIGDANTSSSLSWCVLGSGEGAGGEVVAIGEAAFRRYEIAMDGTLAERETADLHSAVAELIDGAFAPSA